MFTNIKRFFKSEYQTLNLIQISKQRLIVNYKQLASLDKGIQIAPVLKSNAYGHGIIEIAKVLDEVNAPFFCVDSLYEAYKLQKISVKTPILIMGYTDPENFKVKKLPFSYTVFDLELTKILDKYQPGCKVHIFVDTGMNREGIPLDELPNFLTEIKKLHNLKIEGLMSHLASADNKVDPLNKIQINNFKKALQVCKKHGINPRWIHLFNSDGLLNLPGVGNLTRSGLALYGISSNTNLKPILTLKTRIIQIKRIKTGDRIGYNCTFIAKHNMTIGILPLGYYDGVDRKLSNKGIVQIMGIDCPILGKVSMNITTIDITHLKNPQIGEEVIVYSNNSSDKNSIENIAKTCNKIPYEILVNLAESTRRVVI